MELVLVGQLVENLRQVAKTGQVRGQALVPAERAQVLELRRLMALPRAPAPAALVAGALIWQPARATIAVMVPVSAARAVQAR